MGCWASDQSRAPSAELAALTSAAVPAHSLLFYVYFFIVISSFGLGIQKQFIASDS